MFFAYTRPRYQVSIYRTIGPLGFYSVMSGQSHRFLGITSTFRGSKCVFAQGHNTTEVGYYQSE